MLTIPIRVPCPPTGAVILPVERVGEVPRTRLVAVLCAATPTNAISPGVPQIDRSLVESIRLSRATADALKRPILAYCDDDHWSDAEALTMLRPTDWIAWHWYREAGERRQDLAARYAKALLGGAHPIIQVIGAHDRAGRLKVFEIAEAIIEASIVAKKTTRIIGAIYFAEGRADSLPKHPILRAYLDAFGAGTIERFIVDVILPSTQPPILDPPVVDPPVSDEEAPMLDKQQREEYITRRGQCINTEFPALSVADARQRAHEIDEALQKGGRNATPTEIQEGARIYLLARAAGGALDHLYAAFLADSVLVRR